MKKKRPYNLTINRLKMLQEIWENDPRNSFGWLLSEKGIKIPVKALKEKAVAMGWQKKDYEKNYAKKFSKKNKLTTREKNFIKNRPVSSTDLEAKFRAGYSEKGRNIQPLQEKLATEFDDQAKNDEEAIDISRRQLLAYLKNILFFDMNEVAQVRRKPCKWCYSNGKEPLMSKQDFFRRKISWEQKHEGETYPEPKKFYDNSLPPNPECPMCHGEGEAYLYIPDSRKLGDFAKMMYCGAKTNKDGGIEVVTMDRMKALEWLCKAFRVFEGEPSQTQINVIMGGALSDRYEKIMQASRDRQEKLAKERLNLIEVEDAQTVED